jgi:small subunit ribosomal protein S5
MADEQNHTNPEQQPQVEQPAQAAPEAVAAPADQAPQGGEQQQGGERQVEGRGGRGGDRGGRGGDRGGRGRGGPRRDKQNQPDESGVESSLVRIYRCAKVVKGGRTFSFGALMVVGDRKGSVGIGYGKANEVPNAVEKGTKDARKQMFKVNLKGSTIPHQVTGRSGASTVVLAPARPGTGVTAGKSVRPVLELAGSTDILTKAYGSTSPKNLVKATLDALRQLKLREQVEATRGVMLEKGAGELVTAE